VTQGLLIIAATALEEAHGTWQAQLAGGLLLSADP
jgi:hypothetical protein